MSSDTSYSAIFDNLTKVNQQLFNLTPPEVSSTLGAVFEQQQQDYQAYFNQAFSQPENFFSEQLSWWQQQLQLANKLLAEQSDETLVEVAPDDHRFDSPKWQEQLFFNYLKQSYLLTSKSILSSINNMPGLNEQSRERLNFFTRQSLNALSPSNFIATNPELLELTLAENGENLVKGMELLKQDLTRSVSSLNIGQTQEGDFEVGKNVAITPGKVVYKNQLFELIQYSPKTKEVYKKPLLVVPPFINKYYIMDLNPKTSLYNWYLEQGHTVFTISWVNPDESHAQLDFEDYVTSGVLKALEMIEGYTGEREVNAVGYCIGGTLLATTVAYMQAKRIKRRVASQTLLTTILDFSLPGEVGAFVNEAMVSAIEIENNLKGYRSGRELATTFSLLRENSLYWNYYISKYLKGESPMAFDLLYWNGDSSNCPAACHNFLLRQLYLNNQLIKPGGISIKGMAIDLSKTNIPTYFLSTKEDHIALWQGTYKGAQLLGDKCQFVLGGSGHIAGVINHPDKNKYGYWTNPEISEQCENWLEQAEYQQGSWWTHWQAWFEENNKGKKVAARKLSSRGIDAPGEYVLKRL
jgi:polyhydroxyalkanoate synthase